MARIEAGRRPRAAGRAGWPVPSRRLSLAFAVTGMEADGTRVDASPQAQAVSSNAAVATVEIGPGSQIQVHAGSPGSSTITGTFGSPQQTCAVTVNRY